MAHISARRGRRVLATGLVALLGFGQALAMTVTEEGTIWQGYDGLGLFGGGNLAGRAFVLSIAVDSSAYQYQVATCNGGNPHVNCALGNNASPYSISATVNGVTLNWTTDATAPNGGQSYLANFLTSGIPGFWDEIYQYGYGRDAQGAAIIAQNAIYSYLNSMGLDSLDFAQDFSYTPLADDYQYAFFKVEAGTSSTSFEVRGGRFARESGYGGGAVDSLRVVPTLENPYAGPGPVEPESAATQIPEPATLALLFPGVLAALAYRRRRQVAVL